MACPIRRSTTVCTDSSQVNTGVIQHEASYRTPSTTPEQVVFSRNHFAANEGSSKLPEGKEVAEDHTIV